MKAATIKAGAVIGAAAALAFAGRAHAATISSGHVDALSFTYDDTANTLGIEVHDEAANAAHDPAEVVFDVHSGHLVDRPSATACRFDAGDNWVIPRTDTTGLLWAGWSTEELELADFGGELRAELVDAVTPAGGDVSVYDATTGATRFHTDPACEAPGTDITESHHHPTWVFTEPGTYELTFQVSGTHTAAGAVTSAEHTYTFDVG
ncbi:choice-of-anchor M domain-containing protein [Glycomyces tenuis]|uniref:choice-of-anchor M domain-containing protein n=1 Tax=Glycomyces tenuis TaxID=58116 RepID=UPI00041D8840|nr:choice-of-anchor M domain-containing protein [Glycomyces tenuis]